MPGQCHPNVKVPLEFDILFLLMPLCCYPVLIEHFLENDVCTRVDRQAFASVVASYENVACLWLYRFLFCFTHVTSIAVAVFLTIKHKVRKEHNWKSAE